MNDLQIVVTQHPGIITTNFDDIKAELSAQMEIYKELEVTEHNKSERKKDIATLRKMKKALDDRRIEIKKDYMRPCDEFEAKVKELVALIDEPIVLINNQIKVFEENQKAEKIKKIHDTYNELIGEMADYLPLDKIYNSKWENVSITLKSIREEIEEAVSSTEMAVNTIKGMNSEAVPMALEQYRKDLSLANAIAYVNRYEQQKAEILAREEQKRKEEEERRRREEEERIREEERKRIAEEERIREEARQKAIEEERLRIAEEERLKEEMRKEEQARMNAIEFTNAPEPSAGDILEKPFEEDLLAEEPFIVIEKESFSEDPFDVTDDFIGLIGSRFFIEGTIEQLEQVEMYLDSIGLTWKREDI